MAAPAFVNLVVVYVCCVYYLFQLSCSSSSPPLLTGVHPLDERYYDTELIRCKDGSKSFTRDRLNDNFCDCPDGTDEPGTSACPSGKFYCKNMGSTPRFLYSSRVNDHICDCCDGSDEYDGSVICPNACIMGGNVVYHRTIYESVPNNPGSVNSRETKPWIKTEESTQKLRGLKSLVFLQVALIILFVALRLFRRRKTRQRNSR